jgi:hypothetical protein
VAGLSVACVRWELIDPDHLVQVLDSKHRFVFAGRTFIRISSAPTAYTKFH